MHGCGPITPSHAICIVHFFELSSIACRSSRSELVDAMRLLQADLDDPRLPDGTRDKAWLAHAYSIGLKPNVSSFQTGSAKPGITWKADAEIRMINHWDNIDGSIERGYSGRSIFFEGDSSARTGV
jgi:hypothetical protein